MRPASPLTLLALLTPLGCTDSAGEQCSESPRQCALLGESRCKADQRSIEECVQAASGCNEWTLTQSCGASQACVEFGGAFVCTCLAECLAAGLKRCLGTEVQVCAVDEADCLTWSRDSDCGLQDRFCVEDDGEADCRDECSSNCEEAGGLQCMDDVLASCDAAGECLVWSPVTDCAALSPPQFCDSTTGTPSCVESCVDECPAIGNERCVGQELQHCVQAGDCRDWVKQQDCSELEPAQSCIENGDTASCTARDPCISLGSIVGDGVASGANAGEPDDFQPSCTSTVDGQDVCYTWTAPMTAGWQIDTEGSDYHTILMVLRDGEEVACDDDLFYPNHGGVIVDVAVGEEITIVVDAYYLCAGTHEVNINTMAYEEECENWDDDDLDRRKDCADPTACQGTPACESGSVPIGGPCAQHSDCAATNGSPACFLEQMGWAGGTCGQWCVLGSDDCPAGSRCTDIGFDLGMCMKECTASACRSDTYYDTEYHETYGYTCCFGSQLCQPTWWACDTCGNGAIDGDEQCESGDLGGGTCQGLGYDNGTLECDNCRFDPSGCTVTCHATSLGTFSQAIVRTGENTCSGLHVYNSADNPAGSCAEAIGAGYERLYQVTVPAGRPLTVAVANATFDASLWVTSECTDLHGLHCLAGNHNPEIVALEPAATSTTYTVVVDAYDVGECGTFDLMIDDSTPETACTDFIDNDQDDLVDCFDPVSCSGSAACVPGAQAMGTPCTANTQCAASNSEPACITQPGPSAGVWRDGYCSQWCQWEPIDDCPAGSACVPLLFDKGFCHKTCTGSSDTSCRADGSPYAGDGYVCSDDYFAGWVCGPDFWSQNPPP